VGIGDWLFLLLVCVSPIPLVGLLMREFIYSFHPPADMKPLR